MAHCRDNADAAGAQPTMLVLQSLLGAIAIPALAFAMSENHRAVSWRRVFAAMALTIILATLLLKIPALRAGFAAANRAVDAIAAATRAGHQLRVRLSWRRSPAL